MGKVMATPTKTALEKLVLFKNSTNSLTLFVIKFEIGV